MMPENRGRDTERTRAMLEAYGAEPRRWPAELRDWARESLLAEDEKTVELDQAKSLDRLLDAAQPRAPDPAFMAEVLAEASPVPWSHWRRQIWPFGPLWQPASGLAVAGLFGLLIGLTHPRLDGPAPIQAEHSIDGLLSGMSYDLESL